MHVSFIVITTTKNYDILCKGPFSDTMPKARKILGSALVYSQLVS